MIEGSYADDLEFERRLQNRLKPVKPDPDFVSRLSQRLRTEKRVFLEQSRDMVNPVLVVIGVLLGIGLIFLVKGRYRK